MTATTHRVAIVGGGRQGQRYAAAYRAFPETQIVAIVDPAQIIAASAVRGASS